MKKTELVEAVAAKAALTKKDAKAAVEAVLSAVAEELTAGQSVTLAGFGTFSVKSRDAKTCRNPRTGEAVEVPACKAVAFKAGSALKESVNK